MLTAILVSLFLSLGAVALFRRAALQLPRSRTVNTSAPLADRYLEVEGITHTHGTGGTRTPAAWTTSAAS